MTCPICLENNSNMIWFNCTHNICYTCFTNTQHHDLNGCPICRQGGILNYTTMFPDTQQHYPQQINNFDNSSFLNLKNQFEDLTYVEKEWINQNIGQISDCDLDELIQNHKYAIIVSNNIFFGKFISESRDNNQEYLFGDCDVLDRRGSFFKCSPPTRMIKLINPFTKIYQIN